MPAKRWLLVPALLLSLATASLAIDAGDWVPVGPPPDDPTAHDLELTLRAREVLLGDPELRHCRLGVDVFHRRAMLWGEVPSPEVGQRARQCLRRLVELQEIREEWHVVPEPAAERRPGPLGQRPPVAEAFIQPRRTRGALVHRPDAEALAPGRDLLWHPTENRHRAAPPEDSTSLLPQAGGRSSGAETPVLPQKVRQELGWRPGLTAQVPAPSSRGSQEPNDATVLPSIRLAGPAPAEAGRAVPSAEGAAQHSEQNQLSPALPKAANLVQEKIESLRRSDARFAQLRVELKEGIVFVSGAAAHWEHVYDLARAIARLPGVQRVVLKDVRADS